MGGRLILELLAEKKVRFAAIDLVAPAEDLKGLFGGHDSYDKLKATADKEGYVDFTSIYSTLPLSKEWFADLEKHSDDLVELAAKNYRNSSLVIWALDDNSASCRFRTGRDRAPQQGAQHQLRWAFLQFLCEDP